MKSDGLPDNPDSPELPDNPETPDNPESPDKRNNDMTNKRHNYQLALALVLLLAVGCQEDDDNYVVEEQEHPVQLLMGMQDRGDGGELTRAGSLPTGYTATSYTSDPGKIAVFMTKATSEETITSLTGTFNWASSTSWTSTVNVKYQNDTGADNNYYVYGYMPRLDNVAASISSSSTGRYSVSATMTLKNVRPVSAQDLCIITGAKNGVKEGTDSNGKPIWKAIDAEGVNMEVGKYLYVAQSDNNAMYLLLDHVYSQMKLKMQVDTEYDKLRTIKVTEMKMSGSAPTVNIVVNYLNNGSAPTTSITSNSDAYSISEKILNTETEVKTTATDLTSFYCASTLEYITMTTTFDVYDKSDNKLRSNCTTTNKIYIGSVEKGKTYTLTATIKPTFLYQLGDADFDQPTVVIN